MSLIIYLLFGALKNISYYYPSPTFDINFYSSNGKLTILILLKKVGKKNIIICVVIIKILQNF